MYKNRTCAFCGKPIVPMCWYSDYGIISLHASGKAYLEFDACEECLNKVLDTVKNLFYENR